MTEANAPINPISGGGAITIGLTKREYFAALAMQGLLSADVDDGWTASLTYENCADAAIGYADALIVKLNEV